MNNNVYPFFIECSKYYQDQPYKQLLLQKFAFGCGGSLKSEKNFKNTDALLTFARFSSQSTQNNQFLQ